MTRGSEITILILKLPPNEATKLRKQKKTEARAKVKLASIVAKVDISNAIVLNLVTHAFVEFVHVHLEVK